MSERRRVLVVVDDDPRVLESLENLFESAGYIVRAFSSPKAVLEAGNDDIDCLITDISMPVMDGFELRDRMTRHRPELPVFMVTGRHELADQGRAQGISGFFRKPFDGQALLAAVGEAVRNRKQEG